jgi:hypothetical protein
MDPKTIGIGLIAVGAAITSVVAVVSEQPKQVLVAAGETEADVAVTQIANINQNLEATKNCERQWVIVNGGKPEKAWLCDGAYDPRVQKWLNGQGEKLVKIELAPKEKDGKTVFDMTTHEGEVADYVPPRVDPPPDPGPEPEKLGEVEP